MNRTMRIFAIAVLFFLVACSEKERSTMDSEKPSNVIALSASSVTTAASDVSAASGVTAIFGVTVISGVAAVSFPRLAEKVKNCDPTAGPISDMCPIPPSLTWWKCDEWPPEERQVPTEEQKQRLLKFAVGIFSPEVPGDYSSSVPRNVLIKRFGQPASTSSTERLAYDPGDPMEIVTNWEYRGFKITTVASKPKPDELSIEKGEIFGEEVSLLYGVRVGQPIDRWVQQFGRPKCGESQGANAKEYHLNYEPDEENFIPCDVGSCLVNYSIGLILDVSGKVKRMYWSYPMM
jgi:hypothetical protein